MKKTIYEIMHKDTIIAQIDTQGRTRIFSQPDALRLVSGRNRKQPGH